MPPRKLARYALLFLLIAVAVTAGAGSQGRAEGQSDSQRQGLAWMSGASIRTNFEARNIAGQYPNGNLWYEQIFSTGRTDYREGQKRWAGTWWVTDREFCFQYPPPGIGGCFRVVRLSANCFELYDFSGATAKEEVPPTLPSLWNGRMWLEDLPTTCEQLSTS